MDVIQLLPDTVANQIAAGEVIQRPASVVKELVENAVDAGATEISVLVVDAGRTSIQVIDNGKGMSETDARLSFERHATSKIRQADDLFALHTMGFRGEALASIAAVAQVELKTRMETDELGTQLFVEGGRLTGQEPVSCPVGSNFLVKNLFYNVPPRRKFLKSNSTEMNNIVVAFQRIALVNPNIAFSLYSNGAEMFCLGKGSTKQRIVDVFGKKINQDLLPVAVETSVCTISGFVGKPEAARKKANHQYFFVNGRYMRHAYFHKAVMSVFERLVPAGEQVPYFIYFDVEPSDIDVNIHPTKTEIKFENEQVIWQILAATVKEAIGKFNEVPSIDFDTQGRPDIPVFNPTGAVAVPKTNYNPQYNPFKETPIRSHGIDGNWEQLYADLAKSQDAEREQGLFPTGEQESLIADKAPVHYQYKGTYVMTAVKSGLMIINQHRAHVRILYDEYMRQLGNRSGHSQKVLFPEVVQFAPTDDLALRRIMPELESLGFELTDLGNGSYAMNSIPTNLDGIDMVALIRDLVSSTMNQSGTVRDEVNHSLALSLARSAAIPRGQILNNGEMENVVNQLFQCSNVNYTPDGKRILTILKQQEIDHLLA